MTTTFIMWVVSLLVALWLFTRLNKLTRLYTQEKEQHQRLQTKFDQLDKTLATRGRRLDVLLSTVTEVVLRVDKLGRVLGGNTKASDLFEFGKSPKLPQSMLIFYRDNDWLHQYHRAIKALPEDYALPEMKIKGRVLLPRLAALGEKEALLLCMDVTAYTLLQQKQKSLLENLMHDLKTPLTSLLGYARSIEAFADDEALRKEATTVIASEAKHINELMNSMLTLNQIEYQNNIAAEACDVVFIGHQVWGALELALQKKNITLHIKSDLESAKVSMSESDLNRVFTNVAENAIKFSPTDSNIYCEIQVNETAVTVSIRDEGHGIPKAHINRVTERFYRVDNVRGREVAQGHGLGLAIVKETLERDGGHIKLKNHSNGGLQAKLTLLKAV